MLSEMLNMCGINRGSYLYEEYSVFYARWVTGPGFNMHGILVQTNGGITSIYCRY